ALHDTGAKIGMAVVLFLQLLGGVVVSMAFFAGPSGMVPANFSDP
uniref:PM H(+)-ATPASE=PLASMA membrane H(+)-ATPase (Fragments) n=1 Tax=Dunaliella acidophila TaxID=38272 RepID=Q9S9I0_DUNAC